MAKQTTKKAEVKAESFPQTEANRKRRLSTHLRKHPNDGQAKVAVTAPAPRRRKPNSRGLSNTQAKYTTQFALTGTTPQDAKDVLKATQGRFGKVKPNIFGVEYSRENVRALCYGVGIKFTGRTDKPRSQKRKPTRGKGVK